MSKIIAQVHGHRCAHSEIFCLAQFLFPLIPLQCYLSMARIMREWMFTFVKVCLLQYNGFF